MVKDPTPVQYMVRESFTCDCAGYPVTYRRGEPIHPEDPELRKHPHLFEPIRFPHWNPPSPRIEQATTAPPIEEATSPAARKRGG